MHTSHWAKHYRKRFGIPWCRIRQRYKSNAYAQKAKNDQQIALAQVNQQTAANNQAALTARAELEANAGAQRAALRSGDPAQVAAASAASGDIDWISALSTAANVLF
ncbi:hypothetical protein AGMMS49942_22240 [Spirochaetia bacterium]|nr:hypothetical protein AGMMS49942_22240 [Spirochaetia bacterium]